MESDFIGRLTNTGHSNNLCVCIEEEEESQNLLFSLMILLGFYKKFVKVSISKHVKH